MPASSINDSKLSNFECTNLPPIGYQLFPGVDFDGLAKLVHSKFDSFESFIEEAGITDEIWKKEFRSYYDNITKQSHDFFFH